VGLLLAGGRPLKLDRPQPAEDVALAPDGRTAYVANAGAGLDELALPSGRARSLDAVRRWSRLAGKTLTGGAAMIMPALL